MNNVLKVIFDTTTGARKIDIGLLLLRVGIGSFMLFGHGWGKLASFAEKADTWADPIGLGPTLSLSLAIFAEFFCSLAIILGLATRAAAVPLLITMLVAATIVHAADPWSNKEFALMYGWAFITLILAGAGRFSVDSIISKKLQSKT
ncbi:MAG: DoxX family protein [Candidatus Zixiibacteriota bacterium]